MRSRIRPDLLAPIGAALLLIALMAVCRGASLVSGERLNADEADLLATGRLAALDLLPYVTYTTSTYLTLWPIFLGILARLGAPMSLQTAHVLSGLAYVWIAFSGWYVISRRLGWRWSAVFVLPTAIVLLTAPGPRSPNFLSLGTELLPVSILMLGGVVLFAPGDVPGRRRLAAACVLAGLAVWAKPQVGVVAVALCVVGLLIRRLAPRDAAVSRQAGSALRDLVVAGASFGAPTLAFLLVMLAQGTLARFIDEPVAFVTSYLTLGQDPGTVQPFSLAARWSAVLDILRQHLFAFAWVVPGLGVLTTWQPASRRARTIGAAIVMTPLVAAVLTLGVVMPILWHYLNITYAACMLSGMAGIAAAQAIWPVEAGTGAPERRAPQTELRTRASNVVRIGMPLALAGVLVAGTMGLMTPYVRTNVLAVVDAAAGRAPAVPATASPVATACPPEARVFVWGWAAELYAEFDWTPASRYVYAWWLFGWGRPDVYRATLMTEVTTKPPTCVVEAIGPQFFGLLTEADTIANRMPELAARVATCYQVTHEVLPPDRPVAVWRWNGACAPGWSTGAVRPTARSRRTSG